MSFQQKDKALIEIAKEMPHIYYIKQFHWVDNIYSLIYRYREIMIPKQIQKTNVECHYNIPCYLGETRNELTIGQHFHWKYL